VTFLSRRCDRLVTVAEFALQNWELFTTEPDGPAKRISWHAKETKPPLLDRDKGRQGRVCFLTAADWSDGERRAAVAQILRLNGVPEVYDFSEPSLKVKRGKDSDAKTKGGWPRKAPG
jgi:hypothetical protein